MVSYARAAVPLRGDLLADADAQSLPFADASFDAVVCQFGIMFLPDTPRGFAEAHRVLVPGGTLLANAWHSLDDNPANRGIDEAVADDVPRRPAALPRRRPTATTTARASWPMPPPAASPTCGSTKCDYRRHGPSASTS